MTKPARVSLIALAFAAVLQANGGVSKKDWDSYCASARGGRNAERKKLADKILREGTEFADELYWYEMQFRAARGSSSFVVLRLVNNAYRAFLRGDRSACKTQWALAMVAAKGLEYPKLSEITRFCELDVPQNTIKMPSSEGGHVVTVHKQILDLGAESVEVPTAEQISNLVAQYRRIRAVALVRAVEEDRAMAQVTGLVAVYHWVSNLRALTSRAKPPPTSGAKELALPHLGQGPARSALNTLRAAAKKAETHFEGTEAGNEATKLVRAITAELQSLSIKKPQSKQK